MDIWPAGWKGELTIPISKTTANWELNIVFTNPIENGNFFQGSTEWNEDKTEVTVKSLDWSAVQQEGNTFVAGFVVNHQQDVVSWHNLK